MPTSDDRKEEAAGGIIDLGEALQIAALDPFWAVRGHAVQTYANLEQSLCKLFAMLAGTSDAVAAVIFFRLSASVRNAILEKLFRRKFDDRFNLFRNSLFKDLRPIDIERNEIVHWNVVNGVAADEQGRPLVAVSLRPPNFVHNVENSRAIDTAALQRFMAKCGFYARLINMFVLATQEETVYPHLDAVKRTWLEIFQQPIVYPPPAGHPLSLTPQATESPPPATPT